MSKTNKEYTMKETIAIINLVLLNNVHLYYGCKLFKLFNYALFSEFYYELHITYLK